MRIEDLTRKQLLHELKNWKEKYESLVYASPDAVSVTDLEGKITEVSNRTLKLHGFSQAEELIGKNAFDLICSEDHVKAVQNLKKTLKKGYIENAQYRMLKKDGANFIGELNATSIKDLKGKPIAFIATTRDITEKKRIEDILRKNEHFLENIFESIQEGISVLDKNLTIRRVSQVMKNWYPRKKQFVGKKCYRVYHDRSEPCENCPTVRCLESGRMERGVIPGIHNSRPDWLELFSFPLKDIDSGEVTGVVEFVRDITNQRKIEEALRESEERFHKLSDAAEEGIAIHNNGVIIDANAALARMFGYKLSEMKGMNAKHLATPETWQLVKKHITSSYDKPYEGIGIRKDGSRFFCQLVGKPYPHKGKTHRVAAFRDITELKQTEEALRHSEEKLRNLFESASDGIFAMDMKGLCTEVNERFLELHGYCSRDEVLEKNGFSFVAPSDKKKAKACIRKTLEKETLTQEEFKVLRADGAEFDVEINGSILKDAFGNPAGFIGISRDITERKRIEDELRNYRENLEELVEERTVAVKRINKRLRQEINERKKIQTSLAASEAELRRQKAELEQKNVALREIIAQIEIEKERIRNDVEIYIRLVVSPLLENLKRDKATARMVNLLRYHLERLTSPYGSKITKESFKLTPREIEICSMVRGGLPSKDISRILNISHQTVVKHRKNIRHKLGIASKGINLTTYLREI